MATFGPYSAICYGLTLSAVTVLFGRVVARTSTTIIETAERCPVRAKQSARRRSKTYILLHLTNLLHRRSARQRRDESRPIPADRASSKCRPPCYRTGTIPVP